MVGIPTLDVEATEAVAPIVARPQFLPCGDILLGVDPVDVGMLA